MRKIWEKLKKEFFIAETLRYLIVGLICTFFNLGSAYVFKNLFAGANSDFLQHNCAALGTAIGCALAAVIAFLGNKIYVFKSKSWKILNVIKEFLGTVGARVFAFVAVTAGMKIFVDNDIFHFVPYAQKHFGWSEHLAKGIVLFWFFRLFLGAAEVAFNYIMNKLLIFRKKKEK